MIELHQFAPNTFKITSPFCHKVEVYCQLAKIPYQLTVATPAQAPLGKLPFITDQGKTIADSSKIITYLKVTYGDTLDNTLSAKQHALGHLLQRTCEESLYFVMRYSRWLDAHYWPRFKESLFGGLPVDKRDAVAQMMQGKSKDILNAQGYGLHSEKELYQLGIADLESIANILEPNKFAVSDSPSSYDAILFAFLNSIIRCPKIDSPLQKAGKQHDILLSYLALLDKRLLTL